MMKDERGAGGEEPEVEIDDTRCEVRFSYPDGPLSKFVVPKDRFKESKTALLNQLKGMGYVVTSQDEGQKRVTRLRPKRRV